MPSRAQLVEQLVASARRRGGGRGRRAPAARAATAARASSTRRRLRDAEALELEVDAAERAGATHRPRRRGSSGPAGRHEAAIVARSARSALGCAPWRRGPGPGSAMRPRSASSGAGSRRRLRGSRRSRPSPSGSRTTRQVELLRRLQYRLHTASEHVFGLSPPAGAEPAHTELAARARAARATRPATSSRRSTSGGADGGRAAACWEWRGALFRVRLARLRLLGLAAAAARAPSRERRAASRAPLARAARSIVAGAAAFVARRDDRAAGRSGSPG